MLSLILTQQEVHDDDDARDPSRLSSTPKTERVCANGAREMRTIGKKDSCNRLGRPPPTFQTESQNCPNEKIRPC